MLMHGRPRLKPWEIERLTDVELALAVDQAIEEKKGPSHGTPLDPSQWNAWVAWRRSLTNWQKLEMAKEGWE